MDKDLLNIYVVVEIPTSLGKFSDTVTIGMDLERGVYLTDEKKLRCGELCNQVVGDILASFREQVLKGVNQNRPILFDDACITIQFTGIKQNGSRYVLDGVNSTGYVRLDTTAALLSYTREYFGQVTRRMAANILKGILSYKNTTRYLSNKIDRSARSFVSGLLNNFLSNNIQPALYIKDELARIKTDKKNEVLIKKHKKRKKEFSTNIDEPGVSNGAHIWNENVNRIARMYGKKTSMCRSKSPIMYGERKDKVLFREALKSAANLDLDFDEDPYICHAPIFLK